MENLDPLLKNRVLCASIVHLYSYTVTVFSTDGSK